MNQLTQTRPKATVAIIAARTWGIENPECARRNQMVRVWRMIAILGFLLIARDSFAQEGRVIREQMDSARLKANLLGDASIRPYGVYLPPSYDHTTNRYPVIYALHGYLDDDVLLTKVTEEVPSAIPSFLDSMIASRQLGEVIVVFVSATNRLYGSFQ